LKWPLIPYSHIVINQVFDVCISREKPEKLMDDTFCENFLRSEKGESFLEIASKLISENTTSPCPSTIIAIDTVIHDMFEQCMVRLHNLFEKCLSYYIKNRHIYHSFFWFFFEIFVFFEKWQEFFPHF
jgi:hypothetical protein